MKIEELLSLRPFSLREDEKAPLFLAAMKEAITHHYNNCSMYRKFCEKRDFRPEKIDTVEDIPFLPVDLFKHVRLVSVKERDIGRTVHSSSTTTGTPSSVYLDEKTMKRQTTTMNAIVSEFIGKKRRDFMFIDSPKTIKSAHGELSSRATTMRGFLPFSRKAFYLLNDKLEIDEKALQHTLEHVGPNPLIYGFTYIIYNAVKSGSHLQEKISQAVKNPVIIHSGGWKKLADMKVEKKHFNMEVSEFFNTAPENVLDMYGMMEHLGITYIDCPCGHKHVPVYSDVIIRDVNTFKPVGVGKEGFIQLLTPIPHSYPGVSIISSDIGAVLGRDDCKCGRPGKYFVFRKRAPASEKRGCGDTLGE
jgi:phenylacetate-coenzyme A ligase PaaK-like adenylate-forming protein